MHWPRRLFFNACCRLTAGFPHTDHPDAGHRISNHHDRTDPAESAQPTVVPEVDDNKIIAERREKLRALREQGVAYPNDFRPTHHADDLQSQYAARRQGSARSESARSCDRRPDDAQARDGQGELRHRARRFGPDPVLHHAGRRRPGNVRRLQEVGHGRHRRGARRAVPHQQGRAVGALHGTAPAVQVAASAAGQVPRSGRPGNEVSPALCRPDRHAGNAQDVRGAHQGDLVDPPASWPTPISWKSKRRCCIRFRAAPRPSRSSRTTMRSTCRCSCASRRNCI